MTFAKGLSYATDFAVIVGSLGTAGALIVAVREYLRSGRFRRREQASKVFALPISFRFDERADGSWRWDPFEATITNVSDMPVTDVGIELFDFNGNRVAGRVVAMMSPHGESEPINFPSCAAAPAGDMPPAGAMPLLQLTFKDSRGLEWVREPNGELREIK